MSQFRNLVFEGGGIKGLAYAGAIEVLEKKGIVRDIRRVAGTSAGAITATLLALGANSGDIARMIGETEFSTFTDENFFILGDIARFITDYGIYSGDTFARWMRNRITDLVGGGEITFRSLQNLARRHPEGFRELYVVGTAMGRGQSRIFSGEETPDMPIWQAVRISMSVPLYFTAVKMEGEVYVDGGVTRNYPIDLFDSRGFLSDPEDPESFTEADYPTRFYEDEIYNKETLGFRVHTVDPIEARTGYEAQPPRKMDNIMSVMRYLADSLADLPNHVHLHRNNWHRTVSLDALGVKATDFGIGEEKILALVESGRKGARAYFEWFENPHLEPHNRPLNRMNKKRHES